MKSFRPFLALILMALVLPIHAAPTTLVQNVSHDGETITMRLTRENLRGAHFELLSQNATGTYDTVTPVDERSYIGSVDGYPGAVSCGVQLDDGTFKGAVYFDRGATWFTLGTSVVETRALDYDHFTNYQFPAAATVQAGQGGSTMYGFDLGVDADHDYFTDAGSSNASAFERIEYSVALVRAIYMRDALLRPYLGRVIIRSTLAEDPYTGLTQGDYLSAVRTEWNDNQTSADRDVVAGVSPHKIGGGLAWVGVIATSSAYSVNQSNSSGNFDVVFRHELGHNWGCGHFVGGSPEGTGLMGGNAAGRFSCCETHRVLNHRTSKLAHLDDEGTYTAIELPPYASLDVADVGQPAAGPTTIDVLANDHDANGQTVTLTSFDSTTAGGGSVTQQGQDLLYTPPGMLIGTDSFTYSITDSAGRTATGAVVVSLTPDDPLRLYLPLDEVAGTSAADSSVYANTGAFAGADFDTTSGPGVYGNAPTLDGVDDSFSVSGVRLNSDTVTLTAWIKPGATQNPWAGIIFDRSGGAAGLNIGNGTELRYHWNNNNWGWNSGLAPAADTWTFVALVVEPTQATIFMNSGSGFTSATNTVAHAPASFSTTYVGRDSSNGSRHFNGAIDEARVYGVAMSQSELQSIYDGGGTEAPNPFDGATDVISNLLSWAPGASATGYNVYVGTDQSAVAAATTGSPEFRETTTSAFHAATLADQTTHYWRIDTVTASTTLTGAIWSFTTATLPPPGDAILVNFDRGGGEAFAGGEPIGPTAADSSNWNAATGADGSVLSLIDNAGASTPVNVQWYSKETWGNNDGTGDDEHRLSVGYLDDGDGPNADGKGVLVTLTNIPYATYRIYGLFATDQNSSGSSATVNFNVNGTWALGGTSSTTAAAWGSINANQSANGNYWTEIVPGSVQGNYWTVESSGSTCTIIGELRNGTTRGCLTGVIIEDIPINDPPAWNTSPVNETAAVKGAAYNSTLADDATDPDTNPLTFTKVSGPAWLSVATDGGLSGTPLIGDVGSNSWTVEVTDGLSSPVQETLTIEVIDSVAIDNFSFELPGTVKQTNWESVPGWSSDSVAVDSGVETGQGGTDGSWTGFLAFSDPSVWNRTNHIIAPTDSFTLKGDAKNSGGGTNLRFMLYYDDGGTRVTVATLDAVLTGAFQEFELTFSAGDVPASIGKNLGIELDNNAIGWVGVDNLRLTRVDLPNTPPAWNSSPVDESDATETVAYASTLADDATDLDPLTFSKVSGPAWLSVAGDGSLSGLPGNGDIGPNSWTVDVSDGIAAPVQVTLNIEVLPEPNTPPVWTSSPVGESDATEAVAYASTLADDATDSDPLTFSKVSGPEWLSVAGDGSLSGLPGNGDVGPNSWTMDVSDGIASPVQVTLNIEVQADNDGDGNPDVSDPDDDNDNIPDAWESTHGLNPLVDDRTDNPDKDLYDNWHEYIFDTNPQERASTQEFKIDHDPVTGDPRIRFSSSPNRRYTIEHSGGLNPVDWQELAPDAPGTGGEVSTTDDDGVPHRFYRLRVELP